MVVLTIVAQKSGETVYFDEPIPQVHFMRLLSCSLYNSWHNLKKVGQMSVDSASIRVASIPQGHYNLVGFEKELKSSFDENKSKINFQIKANNPNSALKLINSDHDRFPINVSHALADLIGTSTQLGHFTYVRKLNTPSAYFIHCDLIDRSKTFSMERGPTFLLKST